MSRPATAPGPAPLDDADLGVLLTNTVAGRTGPVKILGPGLHHVAVRLIADGVQVEVTVAGRRDRRLFQRALRSAGYTSATPSVADLRIDLPVPDAGFEVLICRLGPRAFPFPRHTVRELGRAVAPGGAVVLLAADDVPWPTGLVDAWAASANLAPIDRRDVTAAQPFAGSVYELRALRSRT